jgi:hypothetical protein
LLFFTTPIPRANHHRRWNLGASLRTGEKSSEYGLETPEITCGLEIQKSTISR